LSAAKDNRGQQRDCDATTIADHAGQASRYLTDGVELYRCLGTIPSDAGQLAALESSRSLEVILLTVKELHAQRHP